jgi:hypothetical protein
VYVLSLEVSAQPFNRDADIIWKHHISDAWR